MCRTFKNHPVQWGSWWLCGESFRTDGDVFNPFSRPEDVRRFWELSSIVHIYFLCPQKRPCKTIFPKRNFLGAEIKATDIIILRSYNYNTTQSVYVRTNRMFNWTLSSIQLFLVFCFLQSKPTNSAATNIFGPESKNSDDFSFSFFLLILEVYLNIW